MGITTGYCHCWRYDKDKQVTIGTGDYSYKKIVYIYILIFNSVFLMMKKIKFIIQKISIMILVLKV